MVRFLKPTEGKLKFGVIIGIAAAALILSTVVGIFSRRRGDENCDCTSPGDAGWKGFSIMWFILSILGTAGILIWGVTDLGEQLMRGAAV